MRSAFTSVLAWQYAVQKLEQKAGVQDSCVIEVAYQMTEDLALRMQESVATSLVHTIGQRVFLHNFDCQGESHQSSDSLQQPLCSCA